MAKLRQTKNRKRIEEFMEKNPEILKKFDRKNGTNAQPDSTKSKRNR